jgi:hypothetical protein
VLNSIRFIFTTLFLFLGALSRAQEVQPVLSAKHLGKIEGTENPVRKLKKYERFFHRDSIRQARQMNRYWKSQSDSMSDAMELREKALAKKATEIKDGVNSKVYNVVYRPWARKQADKYLTHIDRSGFKMSASSRQMLHNYLVNHFLETTQHDSMLYALKEIPELPLPKQLTSKINIFKVLNAYELQQVKGKLSGSKGVGQVNTLQGKASQYTEDIKKYTPHGKVLSNRDTLKGFVKTEGTKLAKEYGSQVKGSTQLNAVGNQLGEADKLKVFSDKYKGQMNQLQDSTLLKEEAKKKAEELAMKYVADHPEILQGVQRKMSLLMKKYSVVPNSNDLSTATKRTSLKGKTFFERLQVATNFQVISTKPIAIDFSPQIGYRFNSRFVVGAGGLYRKTFKDSIASIAPDVFGFKAFTSYEVLSKFFAYGEFGRNSPGIKVAEGYSKRTWENSLLVGVGRKMSIHPKIEMTLMVGYNFMHQHGDTVYPRPWVIRVGFQTSELAFLNKKKLQANNLKGRF